MSFKRPIEMMVDMSALDEMMGVTFALGTIGKESRYMSDLMWAAFGITNGEFNREIVAYATASGRMGHMFEWGTIGINTSPSNMQLNPADPRARLWKPVFKFYGRGTSGTLDYKFQSSVGTVPKPPADKTGISQGVLNKLKNHIFWNKAFVMETGAPVTITPKANNKRQLLFVPNIWKGDEGYTMYRKSTSPDISANTAGTFTAMWEVYWKGEGEKRMQAYVLSSFETDIEKAYRSIKSRQQLRRPAEYNDRIIRYKAETVRKEFEKAAAERRAREVPNEFAD